MDKFAVDLDQVLNDFEYSELTDQYNATRNPQTSTTSNQSNVTKHSINNVFHSLNEYLNTNINVTDVSQIEDGFKESEQLPKREYEILGSSIVETIEPLRNNDLVVSDFSCKSDNGEDSCEISKENCDLNENDVLFISKTDEIDNLECSEAASNGISKENVTENNDGRKNGGNTERNSNENIILESTVENDSSVEVPNNSDIAVLSEEKQFDTDLMTYEESDDIHTLVDIPKNSDTVEKKHDDTNHISCEEATSLVEETEVIPTETASKVGFQDELDLDDSVINKLLEEFEDELKIHEGDLKIEENDLNITENEVNQGKIIAKNNIADQDDVEDEVEFIEENFNVEEHNNKVNDDCIDDFENDDVQAVSNADSKKSYKEKITKESEDSCNTFENTKNEPELEVNHEVQLSQTITNVESENTLNIAEVVTSVDHTKSLLNPKDGESEENTSNNEVVEQKAKGDCQEEKIIDGEDKNTEIVSSISDETLENVGKELEESVESCSRPQNLSLKETVGDIHREINLIGNPGSTPYNNVYISEEIHKQEAVDSDTDCSTASSHTFSDASSTTSTASTEEIKDDNEVNPEKNVISTDFDENVQSPSSCTTRISTNEPENLDGNETVTKTMAESVSDVSGDQEVVENEQSDPPPEVDLGSVSGEKQWLGKEAPLWIPDSDTTSCLHCDMKFTVLKRRHHCRACGLVLCSKCCHLRFKLEYLDAEARVCNKCHDILNKDTISSSSSDLSPDAGNSPQHQPNPNNPSEYCSTVSPLQQVASSSSNPPAVMVPVGVLKRKGSNKGKSNKSVMFCDGIRPGSDLTNLDNDFNYNNTKTRKLEKSSTSSGGKMSRNLPIIDSETNTFIPKSENALPPLVTTSKTEITYTDCCNNATIVDMLENNEHTFALHLSLHVHVKIIDMSCCINKKAWCFATEGMINVGQDEIVILLEYINEESLVPKDVFYHINNIYTDAVKGTSVKELGLSLHNSTSFLDSKNHAGFVFIRPTFQCTENIIKPKDPYLIGILIHRWETPWAKLFPLRLILRLGAEYRYYPCPIISTRHRDSVFVEIGHTIINLLADFRNFSYTLPQIRGLIIHMEDKNTTVTIPSNRYDQVIKSLNNTSDHILAFAGNFSQQADSHLVCIQDTQSNDNCYSTHAINIQNKPRKITGASFIVFNGALKSSSGLTAKSNIVEDGLMIQVLPEHMQQIRDKLRSMKNHTISCGCVNADTDETVNIVWGENDVSFNMGVTSAIDNMSLSGIPSIRVHNGKNHVCVNGNRIIRWTEVFIIQNGDENSKNQDPVDISRISENIAKATCAALVKYLDLLMTNNFQKLGIRVTLREDNVSYIAGSNSTKLPPIYMKSLDNELIPVLHRITSNDLRDNVIVLELIFRILNV